MPLAVWIVAVITVSFALAYLNSSGWFWIGAGAVVLLAGLGSGAFPMDVFLVLSAIFALSSVVLGVSPLRRLLVSRSLLAWYRGQLPAMSQTEQEAIDAGTVWWDGENRTVAFLLRIAARVPTAGRRPHALGYGRPFGLGIRAGDD